MGKAASARCAMRAKSTAGGVTIMATRVGGRDCGPLHRIAMRIMRGTPRARIGPIGVR